MTTINTIENLLRLVREDEEVRVALRRELLTEELLALPGQFAVMLDTQNTMQESQAQMLETQNQLLTDMAETRETQAQMLETQNQLLTDLAETRETQAQMFETQNQLLADLAETRETQTQMLETQNRILRDLDEVRETFGRRLDNIETNVGRISHDFRNFRGNYAQSAAVKDAVDIVIGLDEAKSLSLDETRVKVLTHEGITALAREYGTERLVAIPRRERRSFYRADLIIEATKADGQTSYIAVEASYTCDARDTDRALSHAALLTKFTGRQAWPVIAGVRIDRHIQPLIDSGKVFWYPLEDEDVGPAEPV